MGSTPIISTVVTLPMELDCVLVWVTHQRDVTSEDIFEGLITGWLARQMTVSKFGVLSAHESSQHVSSETKPCEFLFLLQLTSLLIRRCQKLKRKWEMVEELETHFVSVL